MVTMNSEEDRVSKTWSSFGTEMQCEDGIQEAVPITISEKDSPIMKTDEYFDAEYEKLEMEDAIIFKK